MLKNTDDKQLLNNIFGGLTESGQSIVMPLYPRTRAKVKEFGIYNSRNASLVDPESLLRMGWPQTRWRNAATDSGRVQKGAYFDVKPSMSLRDETVRVEFMENGGNRLLGLDADLVSDEHECKGLPDPRRALYGSRNTVRKVRRIVDADICAL